MIFLTRNSEASECTMHHGLSLRVKPMDAFSTPRRFAADGPRAGGMLFCTTGQARHAYAPRWCLAGPAAASGCAASREEAARLPGR